MRFCTNGEEEQVQNEGLTVLVETVKSENFEQSTLTDESFSIFIIHAQSGVGGAALVLGVLGLACLGYALARVKDRRREAARRAATTLEILKIPE